MKDHIHKKNVGILLFDNVEVLDFAGPFEVFSVASELHNYELFDVFTFGKSTQAITAVNGLSVNPKYSLDNAPQIDMLVIPGGDGSKALIKDQQFIESLKKISERSFLTMTVCSGARVPAAWGWLDNKPYSTHHEVYESIQQLVPTAIPQTENRYTHSDEKLYTAGGISAGIDLSFYLLRLIHGEEVVSKTARYMEYRLEK